MSIFVNCRTRTLTFAGQTWPCRIGREGFISVEDGREGDGKTPLGTYNLRFGLYRPDRLPGPPPSALPLWPMRNDDGWCDDANDPAYNRFVKLPYKASTESLWREDGAYDVVLIMSHNDSPPQRGLGSAVFIHVAQPDDRATLGCVALTPDTMVALLRHIQPGEPVRVATEDFVGT